MKLRSEVEQREDVPKSRNVPSIYSIHRCVGYQKIARYCPHDTVDTYLEMAETQPHLPNTNFSTVSGIQSTIMEISDIDIFLMHYL